MSSGRILLVEDDELIGTMVEMNLQQQAFEVRWAKSAEAGLERAENEKYDLVILDLMLPGMNGIAAASALRRRGVGTPILMMTARDEVKTKVSALDGGADDYITKPFDVEELVARVRALIRRGHSVGEIPTTAKVPVAGGEVDVEALTWTSPTREVHPLTEKEASLLALLARSGGRVLSRQDIIEEVWGMDALPPERTVDNFILRLRRLIETDPERPTHIVTVRGKGYKFNP
jgi:DNA-binding response OmpR family regulator